MPSTAALVDPQVKRTTLTFEAVHPGPFTFPFLSRLLKGLRLTELDRSTAVPGLNRDQVYEITVPVPPPSDQKKASAFLDQIDQTLDSSIAKLSAFSDKMVNFRRTILSAACTGRLTEDWRGENSPSIDDDREDGLPSGWTRSTVEELAEPGAAVSYGIVKPGPEVPDGVPYVRQQDVVGGTVLIDQLARTSTEIASKYRRTALREGDVLLCIIRNLRVAIVPPGIDGANITQGMVRIRPGNQVLGDYLAYYLSAPGTQQKMRDQYVGLAMPRINVRDARALVVDLPPLDEQHEIVSRVRHLLSLADVLKERSDRASDYVERSAQSVLAKAFGGQLSSSSLALEAPE